MARLPILSGIVIEWSHLPTEILGNLSLRLSGSQWNIVAKVVAPSRTVIEWLQFAIHILTYQWQNQFCLDLYYIVATRMTTGIRIVWPSLRKDTLSGKRLLWRQDRQHLYNTSFGSKCLVLLSTYASPQNRRQFESNAMKKKILGLFEATGDTFRAIMSFVVFSRAAKTRFSCGRDAE